MQVTTKAIVFSSLKFGDTSLIVKAFTASDGLKSYLLKGILASKKGKLKVAYFQPLTQLELVALHRNKGTLETIKEAKIQYAYVSIHCNLAKNALVLFLAELLGNAIQEEERNPELFQFMESAFQWLDLNTEVANFHLVFLLRLTQFLGFYPETSEIAGAYFDLEEGRFTDSPTLYTQIKGDNLTHFKLFLGTDFDTMNTIGMSKYSRQELLKSIMLYYELHIHGFRNPKSLAILNEVFS
ncbi:DNA repair protein RecO [Arenibacter sp. GZD96]|uniref:DNA repair protein RecO n=1 Tax=Aurantibrevibacter litoralis TaxID=3106030 RepID=UPI002AFDEF99|nr:DNA repair protein RecO [Arenibacter sp. GZD-96]MEA1786567.1 DNA repair protein RecO [Arenibacter sp. GZD-96]